MERYLQSRLLSDLRKKPVFLTGPRQVGKTTLGQSLAPGKTQYLNYDVAADRAVIERGTWRADTSLLVMDEIHKMGEWKRWLKGGMDARPSRQALLITGSARMETFHQSGESLAGRFLALRLHPISVREWCDCAPAPPGARPDAEEALSRLLQRGGFPEPMLAQADEEVDRWRKAYFDGLVREDVLEFSRIQEVTTMRLFTELLRERVGSPLSLASMARDLAVSPPTLRRYLDILQALFIVFTVQPWHRNVARSVLQQPKVYFHDTGLVVGDEGLRFENLVACHLLKHAQWQQDAFGRDSNLHYLRTKDGAEVDFALADRQGPTHLIECKWADPAVHRALARFAGEFPRAQAVQIVRHLRQEEDRGAVRILRAADWLAGLSA
jgi:uncharacterized protein